MAQDGAIHVAQSGGDGAGSFARRAQGDQAVHQTNPPTGWRDRLPRALSRAGRRVLPAAGSHPGALPTGLRAPRSTCDSVSALCRRAFVPLQREPHPGGKTGSPPPLIDAAASTGFVDAIGLKGEPVP